MTFAAMIQQEEALTVTVIPSLSNGKIRGLATGKSSEGVPLTDVRTLKAKSCWLS
jgi:hypothetical protein